MTTPRAGGRRRTRTVKIVVTGAPRAGKSTFIRTISEITVLSTERVAKPDGTDTAAGTPVAMDLGRITLGSDLVLTLLGTPAEERFELMWDVLGDEVLGYVLLVDGTGGTGGAGVTAEAGLAAAAKIRTAFAARLEIPFVVAVTTVAGAPAEPPAPPVLDDQTEQDLRRLLDLDDNVPVAVDATDRESVKAVLLALLHRVLAQLDPVPSAA